MVSLGSFGMLVCRVEAGGSRTLAFGELGKRPIMLYEARKRTDSCSTSDVQNGMTLSGTLDVFVYPGGCRWEGYLFGRATQSPEKTGHPEEVPS